MSWQNNVGPKAAWLHAWHNSSKRKNILPHFPLYNVKAKLVTNTLLPWRLFCYDNLNQYAFWLLIHNAQNNSNGCWHTETMNGRVVCIGPVLALYTISDPYFHPKERRIRPTWYALLRCLEITECEYKMNWEGTASIKDTWIIDMPHAVMATICTIPATGSGIAYMLHHTGDNVLCKVLYALSPRVNPAGQIESINKDYRITWYR